MLDAILVLLALAPFAAVGYAIHTLARAARPKRSRTLHQHVYTNVWGEEMRYRLRRMGNGKKQHDYALAHKRR